MNKQEKAYEGKYIVYRLRVASAQMRAQAIVEATRRGPECRANRGSLVEIVSNEADSAGRNAARGASFEPLRQRTTVLHDNTP
jgi:hypothetical protein